MLADCTVTSREMDYTFAVCIETKVRKSSRDQQSKLKKTQVLLQSQAILIVMAI